MSLFVASLNSGSNGNCYYIGNEREAVLVDAGLSCRETEKRMKRMGLNMGKVRAIFISHEHNDHIRGLEVLAGRYQLPVYITKATLQRSGMQLTGLATSFAPNDVIPVGELAVKAFPKEHDAIDPYSFVVSGNGVNIGVITDIGIACTHVASHFAQCHAAFLEANYDATMLENGRYPYHLKNRIRGGRGHISNAQALELFMAHKPPFMSHLFLSHLSRDNNSPELALSLFAAHAGETKVIVASRYCETQVYHVTAGTESVMPKVYETTGTQMALF